MFNLCCRFETYGYTNKDICINETKLSKLPICILVSILDHLNPYPITVIAILFTLASPHCSHRALCMCKSITERQISTVRCKVVIK